MKASKKSKTADRSHPRSDTVTQIRKAVENTATGLAVFLMLSLILLSFLQVILRNFFSVAFITIEKLIRHEVLWIAFIGATLTTLRGRHISIDILPRYLRGKAKQILQWIISLSASVICLILCWYSISFIQLEIEFGTKIGGHIPAWIVQIILPVGFLLLAISFPLRTLEGTEQKKRDLIA